MMEEASINSVNTSRRWMYISIALIVVLVVQTGVYMYVYVNSQSQYATLQRKYDNLESQYSVLQSEYAGVKSQLDSLQSQLSSTSPRYTETVEGGVLTPPQVFNLTESSVVLITTKTQKATGLVPYAEGSGFVYDKQGHIITNNHVIEGAAEVEVTFLDGTISKARLVGADTYSDLAVIKVDVAPEELHPAVLGNSSNLVVGEQIVAIGSPFGLSNSMTAGIVSQLSRELSAPGGYSIIDIIQVDAAINPGNSGGPLVNMKGEVVGVNTAIISGSGTSAGVGFAVPSNTVRREVPSLIETGRYMHPWLGVSGVNVNPDLAEVIGLKEPKGFLIVDVVEGSPAEKAGLRGGDRTVTINGEKVKVGGDVIVGVDDVNVRNMYDALVYLERNRAVDDTVLLRIVRDGQLLTVQLQLGERPPPP